MRIQSLMLAVLLGATGASIARADPAAPASRPSPAPPPAWAPVPGRIMTRWAGDVSPEHAWPEYPRPTMVRSQWLNLNGLWEYAIAPGDDTIVPTTFDGRILVPFPIESALSGVGKALAPDQGLWYRRTFAIPSEWGGSRVLLHFGAVDWQAEVFVDGRSVGTHRGGYDPFTFDITEALAAPGGASRAAAGGAGATHALVVAVRDPSDAGGQPRGKQVRKPEGIWYTRSSGIWQTVWIEPVPALSIDRLRTSWDPRAKRLSVSVATRGEVPAAPPPSGGATGQPTATEVRVRLLDGGATVAEGQARAGLPVALEVAQPRLWSPDDPFLYELRVELRGASGAIDSVASYAGLRDVRIGLEPAQRAAAAPAVGERGAAAAVPAAATSATRIPRILLNGAPLFQFGPLDQGFWPDGLYTAPSVAAMRFDIEAVKRMGGNMLRKHVKVEPELFYELCDRLGVLVWQDMPSGDNSTDADRAQFELELRELVEDHANHPSIVMWVPFNEGWGEHDAKRIAELVKSWDPTRLVNNASGWTDAGAGDVIDVHAYPGPAMAPPREPRASVLGEFGGLGLPVEGHTWIAKDNWGYVSYPSSEALTEAYVALVRALPARIARGLSAAVYTQTTDVEIEVNGWMTYDRAVWKIDPVAAAAAARALAGPPPTLRVVVPNAGDGTPATWRYTTEKPADGWNRAGFDDSAWRGGAAGFGAAGTPGAIIGTEWKSSDIWLRGTMLLPEQLPANLHWSIHHDEDAELFINGVLAATLKGYTTDYDLVPLDGAAARLLQPGRNTIAVHCRQTRGGQYIDVGLVDVDP
ncbi:MAG: glycoside hydrolase family 2 TIM barrel-domain containing protein [Phycisphaerales bacterium]